MASDLEKIIAKIVGERFPDAIIDSISVDPDQDSDGEPILWITVVFDSEISELGSHEMAGLPRHLRPSLLKRQENAFPIFRFMTKRDRDRLRHEAA